MFEQTCLQYVPITVLPAISTTEVGVAVFSVTLKSSVMTLKEQMSSPDPANEEKMPPTNPVAISTKI